MRTLLFFPFLITFVTKVQAQNRPESNPDVSNTSELRASDKEPLQSANQKKTVSFTQLLQQNIVTDVRKDHNRNEILTRYRRIQTEINNLQKINSRAGDLAKNTFDEWLNKIGYGAEMGKVMYTNDDICYQVITDLNEVGERIRQLQHYPDYSPTN